MTGESPDKRRFGRIRDVGSNVADAARSVTGQTAADDIAEFTDAYTDVLSGLDTSVNALERKVDQLERALEQPSEPEPIPAARDRLTLSTASLALLAGIVAIVLAVVL